LSGFTFIQPNLRNCQNRRIIYNLSRKTKRLPKDGKGGIKVFRVANFYERLSLRSNCAGMESAARPCEETRFGTVGLDLRSARQRLPPAPTHFAQPLLQTECLS
jgi:hypothetical protein